MKQRHMVRLECRPANVEGKGTVRQRQLVINSLRMRPNRTIVGEVLGEEALDMFAGYGHWSRCVADLNLPEKAIPKQFASAIPAGPASGTFHRWHTAAHVHY
jgi:Type II/IV secretion system protein